MEEDESKYLRGILKINSIRVRNLPAMDISGLTDPYVVISIGGEKMKTKPAQNTLNADFDDEFIISFDPSKTQDRELKIEVLDHDNIGKDDLIGTTSISILPYLNNKQDVHEDLENEGEKGGLGEIIVNIHYVSNEEQKRIEQEKNEIEKRLKALEEAKNMKGVIKISQIKVRNLPEMDLIEQADPYVMITLGDEKRRTKVMNDNLNAVSDEEIFIPFDPSKTFDRMVKLDVWAYDSTSDDDVFGSVIIPV
ncbi:MAG: hypothetical protein EZS28_042041 [Streblomastix strix]|uniref:C2 domain-containing protein n=1 Tax=Streblomastix strix TaxID=222440 RepID=A0A5J4TWY9_9EUKA|nr:MAG: hypothetical protein EZS28_042041 [Streblomastix strix]